MKYLKLKFSSARLIKEKPLKNMLGSNRFFHPINKMHVYNSICVLLDRTPKPQLRNTDDKYMPLYEDVLEIVSNGYIKIKLISESEKITTIKKDWNSNTTSASQYTWVDCKYVTGTLFPVFIHQASLILNIPENEVEKTSFDDFIFKIQSKGNYNEKNEIVYSNQTINELISWCKLNSCTPLSNYIEKKQAPSRPTQFGKRVHRGIIDSNLYEGIIYIPFNDELLKELEKFTKGFSTILDGGVVTIIGYDYLLEDELVGMKKISELNSTRKFIELTTGVKWSNTIYKNLEVDNLEESIKKIIKQAGVLLNLESEKDYDEMMKKINKVKFNGDNTKDIAYKLNHFIEKNINKQLK